MRRNVSIGPGKRVRLLFPHWKLRLRSNVGTVIRQEGDGWYVVRLDIPAEYEESDLTEIRESWDNLKVVDEGEGSESG